MMKRVLASTALILSLAAAPIFAQTMKVKDVDVSAKIGAIQNEQAARYFANLEPDLEAAIAARLADRATQGQSEDGVTVSVNINEVELANSFQDLADLGDTKLEGNINVFNGDKTALKSWTLAVNVTQAVAYLPEGTDIHALTLDTPVYYEAMVNAFADAVAERVKA